MKQNLYPYGSDEIIAAIKTVLAEVWNTWETAACPFPRNISKRDQLKFQALRTLKYFVNQTAAAKNEHDFFGHCPRCGGNDGYFNIHRDHYFYCELCKHMWLRGSNLFGSWRSEDDEIWNQNVSHFSKYQFVEPVLDWSQKKLKLPK